MRMSVSPKEIAEHLLNEHGAQEALQQAKSHMAGCIDKEAQSVWAQISHALESLEYTEEPA